MTHQLSALAASQDTFEDIRRRYGKAMKELAARGEGRVTAPRAEVGAAYSYFSPHRRARRQSTRIARGAIR